MFEAYSTVVIIRVSMILYFIFTYLLWVSRVQLLERSHLAEESLRSATRDWTAQLLLTRSCRTRNNCITTVCIRRLLWVVMCVLLIALSGCSSFLPDVFQNTGQSTPTVPVSTTVSAIPGSSVTPTVSVTPTASKNANWTTYHYNNARTGYLANQPDPQQLTRAWEVHLDGAVYAEPLVINGHVIVVTEGDSLYSLDVSTGHIQWHTTVGRPVPRSTLPCGDIDPLGITGTPVYDPQTNLVFAVAEVSGPTHILVGVDLNTGHIRLRRPADVAGMDPRAHQQRAALTLSRGLVYFAYGGLAGDCSDYHGMVVASHTNGKGPLLAYQVPTSRQGGIWAPSGPAVDTKGNVYVAVGNGAATTGSWDHSDSVLRLSPTLQLEDGFAPKGWQQENASDSDLGSMGPLLLPGGLIFADGKSGLGYLLKAKALGGIDGQALVMRICRAFGGAAAVGQAIFIPCVDGLREARVGPGAHLKLGWRASKKVTGSPVVGGHMVYSLDTHDGILYALDAKTGAVIAKVSVGETNRFATPALYGSYILVGTLKGVTAITGS